MEERGQSACGAGGFGGQILGGKTLKALTGDRRYVRLGLYRGLQASM